MTNSVHPQASSSVFARRSISSKEASAETESPRGSGSLEDTITLALRAVRHPETGVAALLAGATRELGGRMSAVYLAPAGPGPAELLAVGGPDAAPLGAPGPVEGPMAESVRLLVLETAPICTDAPSDRLPEPWNGFEHLGRIATPLPSGEACLLMVAGSVRMEGDALRRTSAPIAVLASALVSGREVERLRHELHQLRQERSLLAAGLQHDLRAPLSSILGCAATIRERFDVLKPSDREEMLDVIENQGQRLNAMIAQALNREASGPSTPLRLAKTNLGEVAAKVASAARTGRPGQILIEVPETFLVTDTARLERALLNLVDNGLKYSPPGHAVHVLGESTDRGFVFTVADCGPGVNPSIVPTLFSAYATDPNRSDGLGLGLHSVAALIEELGGRVRYARQAGWTRFSIHIPDLRDRQVAVGYGWGETQS
jgi:signal transduction histidine kinase